MIITPQRARVIQVLASGVVLKLPDGREGFLARRDFTHLTTRDLRQAVALDEEFEVVVDENQDGAARVNVRFAAPDAWEQFRTLYRQGSFARGIVSGIEEYGAFVDLLPGVTGLAPMAELANYPLKPDEPPLRIGDVVQCQIQSINRTDRHIRLSLRAAAEERTLQLGRAETPSPPPTVEPFRSTTQTAPRARTLRMLVVDNNETLCNELVEKLTASGHQPTAAFSFAAARATLGKMQFDVLLLDIELGDGSGLDLAEEMLATSAPPRIILMTDFVNVLAQRARIDGMSARSVPLIYKSELSEKLEPLLADEQSVSATERRTDEGANANEVAYATLQWKLDKILRDVRRHTGAGRVLLFQLNDTHQQLEIVKRLGAQTLDERELQLHWHFSPIRDALEDGETIFSEDARAGKEVARFQYLLRALEFASVIGAPVASEPRGALFLFHPERKRFNRAHVQFVRAATERAAAAFEIEKTHQALADSQRFILLGQFGATVIHEVTNKLGRVRVMADTLPRALQDLENKTREGSTVEQQKDAWARVQKQSEKIDAASKEVSTMVTQFDTLSRQTEMMRWDVHEILERALAFSLPYANEAGVEIHRQFQHPAPDAMVVGAWLQQVVLNTVLNAIQQFQEAKKGQGHVLLATSKASGDAQRSIQIRVCDDGPGIHTALHERIFNFGFTTRKGGSGIGLFISRRLIEAMGGRISVEESYPHWGTTILIELPTVDVSRATPKRA